MAIANITVSDPNLTIAQLNDKLTNNNNVDRNGLLNKLSNYLMQISSGGSDTVTITVVVRDTDPAVATSGSGSLSTVIVDD